MNHRIKTTRVSKTPVNIHRQAAPPHAWPSYQGTSELVGTSPSGRVTVYVDPSLGDAGLQNAQDLLNDADRVVNANDGIFGTTGGLATSSYSPWAAQLTGLAGLTTWAATTQPATQLRRMLLSGTRHVSQPCSKPS